MAQQPARFAESAAVKAILDRSGGDDLPVIVVGDAIVASRRYPARDELAAMAGVKAMPQAVELTEQVKELIALGAAIGASCEPCFKFHYDKSRTLGVSVEAMREAVQIGEAVKAASAQNILGLAGRMLGVDEPKTAKSACCRGAKATDEKTSSCR